MTVKNITFSQATLEAMDEEMSRDERVFVMGEDIARQGGDRKSTRLNSSHW